jgi:hypothetical protein
MAFISQNGVDGQYETWIDGVTIRGAEYEAVERIVCEVALQRAWKDRVEESLDQSAAEQGRTPGWGGAEIAIASGFTLALLGVLAAGWQIACWLTYG